MIPFLCNDRRKKKEYAHTHTTHTYTTILANRLKRGVIAWEEQQYSIATQLDTGLSRVME